MEIQARPLQNIVLPSTSTISVAATGGGLVKGAIVRDQVIYAIFGQFTLFRFEYHQSGAGTSGTGIYLITLPSSMQIDLTRLSASTDTTVSNAVLAAALASGHGQGFISDGSSRGMCQFRVWDATRIAMITSVSFTGQNLWGQSGSYAIGAGAMAFSAEVMLPIVGQSG